MIYLQHAQINLGIKHTVSDQCPSISVNLLHAFSFALILQFALLHMLVLTCIVPYFSHMYRIDQLFQKVCIYRTWINRCYENIRTRQPMRKLFVNPSTACFVAAYALDFGVAIFPASEAILIICPSFLFTI